jgi:hypothetical protein
MVGNPDVLAEEDTVEDPPQKDPRPVRDRPKNRLGHEPQPVEKSEKKQFHPYVSKKSYHLLH